MHHRAPPQRRAKGQGKSRDGQETIGRWMVYIVLWWWRFSLTAFKSTAASIRAQESKLGVCGEIDILKP